MGKKNPIYTSLAIFFLILGMVVLILSKINYSILVSHSLFGRDLSDVVYYVGEHIGRLLLIVGTMSVVFMLERYDRSINTLVLKYLVELIAGVLAIRTMGEIFTYSIITNTEYYLHGSVAIVIAFRIIFAYFKPNKNHDH